MSNILSRRRVLLQALGSVVLLSTSRISFGATKNDKEPDNAEPDKTAPGKADGDPGKGAEKETKSKGVDKTGKSAVLTVVVIGDGLRIAHAEVMVTFPPSVRGEQTIFTDTEGEATFNSAGTGTAKVRVIVTGWTSFMQEVVLKEGPQRLTIKLKPLP
jgi:hypothetical protein